MFGSKAQTLLALQEHLQITAVKSLKQFVLAAVQWYFYGTRGDLSGYFKFVSLYNAEGKANSLKMWS